MLALRLRNPLFNTVSGDWTMLLIDDTENYDSRPAEADRVELAPSCRKISSVTGPRDTGKRKSSWNEPILLLALAGPLSLDRSLRRLRRRVPDRLDSASLLKRHE